MGCLRIAPTTPGVYAAEYVAAAVVSHAALHKGPESIRAFASLEARLHTIMEL